MNRQEFGQIINQLNDTWPGRYTKPKAECLWGFVQNRPMEALRRAVAFYVANNPMAPQPAELANRTGEEQRDINRSNYAPDLGRNTCSLCDSYGQMVAAAIEDDIDKPNGKKRWSKGDEFGFACPCTAGRQYSKTHDTLEGAWKKWFKPRVIFGGNDSPQL